MAYRGTLLSCLLSATLVSLVVAANIRVHRSTEPDTKVVGLLGGSITLTCDLEHTDVEGIQWKDRVHNMQPEAQLIMDSRGNPERTIDAAHKIKNQLSVDTSFALTITNITQDDAGDYFCETQYNDTTLLTKVYDLSVTGLPSCAGNINTIEGDQTTLTCKSEFAGSTSPQLQWYIGDQKIASADSYQATTAQQDLKLDSMAEYDSKVALCRLTALTRVEECQLTLNIKYGVRNMTVEPMKTAYPVGEKITCAAKGNPRPKVTWELPEGDPIVGDNEAVVTVKKEWEGKQIELTCRATNQLEDSADVISSHLNFTSIVVHEATTAAQVVPSSTTGSDKGTGSKVKEPKPVGDGSDSSAASTGDPKTAGIIIGIVVGAVVLVIIIIVIVVIKRRNSKKSKKGHMKVPTTETDVTDNGRL